MYVSEFIIGVASTLLVELLILVFYAVCVVAKKGGEGHDEER